MRAPASGRRERWLLGAAVATFAVTLFSLVFHEPAQERPGAADSFSRSALGHRALVELLEGEVPVLVSRGYSLPKASPERPLLLLEPVLGEAGRLAELVVEADERGVPVVVVLPKWQGTQEPRRPEWVASVELLPAPFAQEVLDAVVDPEDDGATRLVRPEGELGAWTWSLPGEPVAPALPKPQLVDVREAPLDTLLGTPEGALVARLWETSIYLVSDPDFLNTAGLARADNAAVALAFLLGHLEPAGLVVDESVHGYAQAESIWRALLEPPLIYLFLHGLLLVALGAWAGSGRFGRPLPAPPRVPPGKGTLIDSSARLLAMGGARKHSLERYLAIQTAEAGERLGVPAQLSAAERVARLSEVGRRRGASEDVLSLARQVHRLPSRWRDPRRLLELARALRRWRKEILDGAR